MSTVTDDIEFDDEEAAEEPAEHRGAKAYAAGLYHRWKSWPMWARIVSVPFLAWATFTVLMLVLGFLASMVGIDRPASEAAPPTTTAPATTSARRGLPAVAPIVAGAVDPADWAGFRNRVNTVTADGTSICDVYFGIALNDENAAQWELTTPALQLRSGVGVQLPSSTWPVRAFYGAPCDAADDDVPLPTIPTSTTLAASGE